MEKKYKAHIPTEQYGFIEVESDNLEDVMMEYDTVKRQFEDKEGLNVGQWAKVRNAYVLKGEMNIEDWELLSKQQKFVINEIKKSIK